jgi:hypothetical protein
LLLRNLAGLAEITERERAKIARMTRQASDRALQLSRRAARSPDLPDGEIGSSAISARIRNPAVLVTLRARQSRRLGKFPTNDLYDDPSIRRRQTTTPKQ